MLAVYGAEQGDQERFLEFLMAGIEGRMILAKVQSTRRSFSPFDSVLSLFDISRNYLAQFEKWDAIARCEIFPLVRTFRVFFPSYIDAMWERCVSIYVSLFTSSNRKRNWDAIINKST